MQFLESNLHKVGLGLLISGATLFVLSLAFGECAGGLIGGGCTVYLHWPTLVPSLLLIAGGVILVLIRPATPSPPRI